MFVAIPAAPFDEEKLLSTLTNSSLSNFFPRETQTFEWRQFEGHRKISKFEIGGAQSMGFNKSGLIIVRYHHFRFASQDIFLGDLFQWTEGNAKEVFNKGLGGESMQGCNDMVEVIYSITGESNDQTNSPCDLVAISPSGK
jgi:hypothetical protein